MLYRPIHSIQGYCLGLLAFASLLCTTSCEPSNSTSAAKSPSKNVASMPTKVTTAKALRKTFERRIQAKGRVVSLKRTELYFPEQRLIQSIAIENGSWVRKGQLIASQNTDFLDITLQKAKQEVQVAQQQFLALSCDYGYCLEDTAKLPPPQKARLMAQSGLAQARIAVKEAQLRIERSSLKAPFSGRIANLRQQPHQRANISRPFCTLYQPQSLAVETAIMESDYGELLHKKVKANIRSIGNPSKTYVAKLKTTNPVVAENGLIQLQFEIQKPKELLLGMNVSLEIIIPQKEQIVVPKEALILRSGRPVVFSLTKDSAAYWHYVTPGQANEQEQAILEGIEEGMEVITSNHLQLAHEAEVTVVNPSPLP